MSNINVDANTTNDKNNVTKNEEVKNQFHISVKSTWWEMS